MSELKDRIRGLLNKVNKVTCAHRRGARPSKRDLDELSNRQIDFEDFLKSYTLWRKSEDGLLAYRHKSLCFAYRFPTDKENATYFGTGKFDGDEIYLDDRTCLSMSDIIAYLVLDESDLLKTIGGE